MSFFVVGLNKKPVHIADIQGASLTRHAKKRINRIDVAEQLMKAENSEFVDRTFVVSRTDTSNGILQNKLELHAVTRNGIIYVLDREKFINGDPCIITVLVARPKQLIRLYCTVGLRVPSTIMEHSRNHYAKNLHREQL